MHQLLQSPTKNSFCYCYCCIFPSYTMAGEHNSLNWSQSDAIAEAIAKESCHIVLETSPPDYVEKISRYLESQSRQDKVSNEPAEAESDSGDSLFLTQKPVPEAVRTRKRHLYSLKCTPGSPRDLQEGKDDTSSSASSGDSATNKKRRRKKFTLPKYRFSFLSEEKWKPRSTLLPAQHNIRLHNATMGGFFKCVRELWQGNDRGDQELSLPTLDIGGDYISPLSEEEDKRSEDEDIRVVEKKRFVAPSKVKCSRPWFTPAKGEDLRKQQRKRRRRRRASNDSQNMSTESQRKTQYKISTKSSVSRVRLMSSGTESSDDEDPSGDTSITEQAETPKTKRRLTRGNGKVLFQEKEREEEQCSDSDATVCEPPQLQGSPRDHIQEDREADLTVTEAQVDVFQTDVLSQTEQEEDEPESQSLLQTLPAFVSDTNNDSVCIETTVKKKKKKAKGGHMSVEEEMGYSQEKPESLDAAASVNVVLSSHEDNRAEPPALQTCDELELSENCMESTSHDDKIATQEEKDVPDSTQRKKKTKKSKYTAENVRQEVGGDFESELSVTYNTDQEKKKKKKKMMEKTVEDDEGVEKLSSTVAELPNDDGETQKKKNKKKKEKRIDIKENTEVSPETVGSSYEKKRRKRKTKEQSPSVDHTQVGEEDGTNVSLYNKAVWKTMEESEGPSMKKKKKKRDSISEGPDISYAPDKSKKVKNTDKIQETVDVPEDQGAEQVTKKKKKKKREKISEASSRQDSEDIVAHSGHPVSVRTKEEKWTSSFLDADSEEKDAQSHHQQSSKFVTAYVWGAEKSAVDVEPESAEIAGNSSDGVSKKKKKKKKLATQENLEEDHGLGFEEPITSCEGASTDTGVKRKKKQKRTDSESVTFVEKLESAADEGQSQTDEAVVLKKKKKKKKCKDGPRCEIQESAPAASEDGELERAERKRKKKCKQFSSPLVAN